MQIKNKYKNNKKIIKISQKYNTKNIIFKTPYFKFQPSHSKYFYKDKFKKITCYKIKTIVLKENKKINYIFKINISTIKIIPIKDELKGVNDILFLASIRRDLQFTQYFYWNIILSVYLKFLFNIYMKYHTDNLYYNKIITISSDILQNTIKTFNSTKSSILPYIYGYNKNVNIIYFLKQYIISFQNYNLNVKKDILYLNFDFMEYLLYIYNGINVIKTRNKKYYSLNLNSFITSNYITSHLYTRKRNEIQSLILYYINTKFTFLKVNYLKKILKKKDIVNTKNKNQIFPIKLNYILNLIEENLDYLTNYTSNDTLIINIRNLLISFWNKKINKLKKTSSLLTNPKLISDFKILKLNKTLNTFLELQGNTFNFKSYKSTCNLIKKPINLKKKRSKKKSLLKQITTLKNVRMTFQHQTYNYNKNKDLISIFFGFPIKLYYINALSITRFEYQQHIKINKKYIVLNKKKSSEMFINKLEREFLRKYKFIAIYLQDFTRIGFLSFFTKNFSFLMQFIALQITKLQKNRKETQLIRFIIKALKIFSAQRPEVLALKVQFKGRVNRWRRTKIITGKRGYIPFYSYKTRLEYATATSITRKGTLGIRFWLYYTLFYTQRLEYSLMQYLNYTSLFKGKKNLKKLYCNKKNILYGNKNK